MSLRDVRGPMVLGDTRVFTGSGNVTLTNESALVVNKSSGAATQATIPSGARRYERRVVIDGKGDAATNNITVVVTGGTINGASSYVIRNNYGSAEFFHLGANAWIAFGTGAPAGSSGVGSANGATVVASERGAGGFQHTVLTLTNTPLAVVSVTTGNGVGGFKLYTFPAGRIAFWGAMGELSLSIAAAKQGDFTDGTPEGDIGLGTLLPANADALGTDATDDNLATAIAFTMSSFAVSSVNLISEASGQQFDGTSTAEDVNLTILVDAADIDDDATTEILATGTINLFWTNLGDVT